MDGKGRWVGNVFIERLWRSAKYERVYLHSSVFNQERIHQSLARQTPDEVCFADRLRRAA
jgi:putative transposase